MSKSKNRSREHIDTSDEFDMSSMNEFDNEFKDDDTESPDVEQQKEELTISEPIAEPEMAVIDEPITAPVAEEPQHEEEVMPTTEVKHQEITPANQTKPTSVIAPKNTAVTRFNDLSRKYIALASSGIKTDDQKKEAVGILSDIVYTVTTSHDRAVFDACMSFFLSNRAIMLSERTVISQVSHYADQTKINRIVQFYVVFTSLIESKILRKRFTININHVRDVFNNRQFAEWLTDKR